MNTRTAHLVRLALLVAVTAVATLVIRIPVPRTGGYVNLGDSVIYITAILFGPTDAMIAGGIGSGLADLYGYPVFAPYTLIIKGLEGFVVGSVIRSTLRKRTAFSRTDVAPAILAICIGGALMILGYFLVEAFVLRLGVGAASTEVPGNIFQAVGGLIVAIPVSAALGRLRRVAA